MRATPTAGFTLVELLIVVAIIASLAAIAIPSYLRARIAANEAAAIADTRTLISAETAYHSAASGSGYGSMFCLLTPVDPTCLGGAASTQGFIDSSMASLAPRAGYNRTFVGEPAGASTGLACFVYNALPVVPGHTGVRGFAGDCSGKLCFTPDGSLVPQANGALDPACAQLR